MRSAGVRIEMKSTVGRPDPSPFLREGCGYARLRYYIVWRSHTVWLRQTRYYTGSPTHNYILRVRVKITDRINGKIRGGWKIAITHAYNFARDPICLLRESIMGNATQVLVRKLRKLEMCSFEWLVVRQERLVCRPVHLRPPPRYCRLAKPCRLRMDNEPERFNCCRRQEQASVHSSESFDGT